MSVALLAMILRATGALDATVFTADHQPQAAAEVRVEGRKIGVTRPDGSIHLVLAVGDWRVALEPGHVLFTQTGPGPIGPLHVWADHTASYEISPNGHGLDKLTPDLPPRALFEGARRADVVVDLCTRRLGVRTTTGKLQAVYDLEHSSLAANGILDAASPGLVAAVPLAESPLAGSLTSAGCTWRDVAPIGLPAGPRDRMPRHEPELVVECRGSLGRGMARVAHFDAVAVADRLEGTSWYADGQSGPPAVVHFARPPSGPTATAVSPLYLLVFISADDDRPSTLLAPRTVSGCK